MVRFLVWGVAHPPAKDRDPTTNYSLDQLRTLASKYAGKPTRLLHSPENVGEVIVAWVNEKKRRLEALFSVEGPGLAPHLAKNAVAQGYYDGLSIGSEMGLDFDTFEVKKDRPPTELSLCPLRLARRGSECRVLWSNAARQQSRPDIKSKAADDGLFDVRAEELDTNPKLAELKKLVDMAEAATKAAAPSPPAAAAAPQPAAAAVVDPKEYDEMRKTLEALKQQEKEREAKKEAKLKAKVEEERLKRLAKAKVILDSAKDSAAEMLALQNAEGAQAAQKIADSLEAKMKLGDVSAEDLEQHGASVTFMHQATSTVAMLIEQVAKTNENLKNENRELSQKAKVLEEKHEEVKARLDARKGSDISTRVGFTPAPATASASAPATAPAPAAAAAAKQEEAPAKSDRLKRLFDRIRGEETEEKSNPVAQKQTPAASPAKPAAAATDQQAPALKPARADDVQVLTGSHITVCPLYSSDDIIDRKTLGVAAPAPPVMPAPFKAPDGTVVIPASRHVEIGGGLQEANPEFYQWIKQEVAGHEHTGMDRVDFEGIRGKRFHGAPDISDPSGNWRGMREPEAYSFSAAPVRVAAGPAAARRIGV